MTVVSPVPRHSPCGYSHPLLGLLGRSFLSCGIPWACTRAPGLGTCCPARASKGQEARRGLAPALGRGGSLIRLELAGLPGLSLVRRRAVGPEGDRPWLGERG